MKKIKEEPAKIKEKPVLNDIKKIKPKKEPKTVIIESSVRPEICLEHIEIKWDLNWYLLRQWIFKFSIFEVLRKWKKT